MARHGAFVLDDWREQGLDIEPIQKAFEDASELDRQLITIQIETANLARDTGKLLSVKRHRPNQRQLLQDAAHLEAKLAALRGSHAVIPVDPDARAVRDAIDRQWSLERRLGSLEQEVKSLGSALRSRSEAGVLEITRNIAVFGFAFYLAAGLAPILAKLLMPFLGARWHTSGEPAPILVLAILVSIFVVASLVFWLNTAYKPSAAVEGRDPSE